MRQAPIPAARPERPPMPSVSSMFSQMWPPKPQFTENDVTDLSGKVFIVTGSNTGIGKEVTRILFSKNARIYMAGRSEKRVNKAIADITKVFPASRGDLVFLHLDLADMSTIKPAVQKFTSCETKLHVLFNNAAVQALSDTDGSVKTKQGHELHLGVNVLGVFLFTQLLTPILVSTAKTEPPSTVRVVWVSSMGTEVVGEKSRGISEQYLHYWPSLSPLERYGISKAGNWLHGVEFASRFKSDGIVSIPCNPGHLNSDLYREGGFIFKAALKLVLYPPNYGAYTELFCGLSPTITIQDTGKWVVPWGRLYPIREDLQDAIKLESEGGNGHAKQFWEWSANQVREYS